MAFRLSSSQGFATQEAVISSGKMGAGSVPFVALHKVGLGFRHVFGFSNRTFTTGTSIQPCFHKRTVAQDVYPRLVMTSGNQRGRIFLIGMPAGIRFLGQSGADWAGVLVPLEKRNLEGRGAVECRGVVGTSILLASAGHGDIRRATIRKKLRKNPTELSEFKTS